METAEKVELESVVFNARVTVEVADARTTVRVMVEVDVEVMVVVAEVRDAAAEDWAAARGERSRRKVRSIGSAERMAETERAWWRDCL